MNFKTSLKSASAEFIDSTLTVKTGRITRKWQLCDKGLATTFLQNDISGEIFVNKPDNNLADWDLFTLTQSKVNFCGIGHKIIQASNLHNEHLLIQAVFEIPEYNLSLKYEIGVYPELSGLFTQLSLKSLIATKEYACPSWLSEAYSEHLCLNTAHYTRYAAGYYNDTQHRYHTDLSILKEQTFTEPVKRVDICDWSNLYALENENKSGLVILKESHKCVNQTGVDTGHFKIYPDAICSTGLGLTSHYDDGTKPCSYDKYRKAWAHWCLLYNGGETGRQTIVKEFDRARFPFRYKRDGIITSNTWGSRGAGDASRAAATEELVLPEIERAAQLGIDCIQIDDGWQCYQGQPPHSPEKWEPSTERFPDGWSTVKAKAREHGVKLGIWFPWYVPVDEMIENITDAGFTQVKIDFLNADTRKRLDEVYDKAKTLSELNDEIQVNADLTEQAPRFGYYYARQYCSLFPQNVEMCHPEEGNLGPRHITYTPHITLKQTWHYAKYMNLNKLQISTQNIDQIPDGFSDAKEHTHDYCFAITMMGLPLFFLETKFYSEAAIRQLEPVIKKYREHRKDILEGMVYPIGDEPDNCSTAGFQSHNKDKNTGYITIFRELHAPEQTHIKTLFMQNKTVLLEDVITGEQKEVKISNSGELPISLPVPASWQLLKYKITS